MANLKFKKGKEFLWAISEDKNEVFILGRRQFQRVQVKEETFAQDIINSI